MANQQGWNAQTPAVQSMLAGALRMTAPRAKSTGGTSRKKRKSARARGASRSSTVSASGKRKTRSKRKGRAKLVKGSAAAKAYMASIRPKR